MNVIFFALTPAQLMNAVILAKETFPDDACDLFYDENLGGFSEAISRSGVFENAYMRQADPSFKRDTFVRALDAVRNYASLFPKIKASLPFDPLKYDRAFVSGMNLWNFEHYYAMKERHPKLSLSVYEEGIYEYMALGLPVNIPRVAFSLLFCHHYYLLESDSLYAHCPDIVRNRWRNIEVKPIPPVSDSARDILNDVFGYRSAQLSADKSQVIFLEQRYFDEKSERRQRELIALFSESLPPERFKIKLHPASAQDKYDQSYSVLRISAPMEIIAMNEDISSNVFVTVTSSAAANLRLMAERSPNIIMLYRLCEEEVPPYLEALFRRIQDKRADGHFWIPSSQKELHEILKSIATEA